MATTSSGKFFAVTKWKTVPNRFLTLANCSMFCERTIQILCRHFKTCRNCNVLLWFPYSSAFSPPLFKIDPLGMVCFQWGFTSSNQFLARPPQRFLDFFNRGRLRDLRNVQYDSIQKNICHSQCSFNSQLHVRFLTSATQLLVANSVRNFTRTLCITAQWNFGLADLINELIQQESLAKSESCHLKKGYLEDHPI